MREREKEKERKEGFVLLHNKSPQIYSFKTIYL
jgi:hypothetical protein